LPAAGAKILEIWLFVAIFNEFSCNLQFLPLQSSAKTSQNERKTRRYLLSCTNMHRLHLLCMCTMVDAVRGEMLLAALFHPRKCVGRDLSMRARDSALW
jgi:hypothetical protein